MSDRMNAAPLLLLAAAVLAVAVLAALLVIARRRERTLWDRAREAATATRDASTAHASLEAELRRARDVAEAANAAKTRYLVSVGHEIRSPLNAIYGYAQLLERGGTVPAEEAGGVIRRSAEHLTNLVEGLLEISRIESGVVTIRTDVVQLPALIDHVVDMFRMQAQAKGIDLRCQVNGRLPRLVRTDEKRLRQILINLMSNAVKYTQAGSATLAIAYRSQVAEIDITDTGIGIAPDDLERIFEPFERGSLPEAALQPGIGLGLAITRVLARILGGEIEVTSTPGTGSRFRLRIFLPEPFSAPAAVVPDDRVTGYAGPRRTVLLIDDDQAQLTVLENLLRQLGFFVYAADNGMHGVELAGRCRPDLVLLDVEMPGISGWETAARLRAGHPATLRIVMVSANAHEFHACNGRSATDYDAFVTKPVELDALTTAIGRELALEWQVAGARPPAEAPVPVPVPDPEPTAAPALSPLPAEAGASAAAIRRLAQIGHIRGIEAALDELAQMPGSAPAVAAMRNYVRAFDLRSLMTLLDVIEPR